MADAIGCKPLSFSEMRLLFPVTEVFTVPGRGVMLLLEPNFVGEEKCRAVEPLRLRYSMVAMCRSVDSNS